MGRVNTIVLQGNPLIITLLMVQVVTSPMIASYVVRLMGYPPPVACMGRSLLISRMQALNGKPYRLLRTRRHIIGRYVYKIVKAQISILFIDWILVRIITRTALVLFPLYRIIVNTNVHTTTIRRMALINTGPTFVIIVRFITLTRSLAFIFLKPKQLTMIRVPQKGRTLHVLLQSLFSGKCGGYGALTRPPLLLLLALLLAFGHALSRKKKLFGALNPRRSRNNGRIVRIRALPLILCMSLVFCLLRPWVWRYNPVKALRQREKINNRPILHNVARGVRLARRISRRILINRRTIFRSRERNGSILLCNRNVPQTPLVLMLMRKVLYRISTVRRTSLLRGRMRISRIRPQEIRP